MKLSPTEESAIRRKAILSINVSAQTKAEVTKKELTDFIKEILKMLTVKRQLKNVLLVLVEIEKVGK